MLIISQAKADAVLIPEGMKVGDRSAQRIGSIADITDQLLGVDQSRGERSWIRRLAMQAPDETPYLFVSKSMQDTYRYPEIHPRRSQDRYRWVSTGDGQIRLGYLIEEGERKSGTLLDRDGPAPGIVQRGVLGRPRRRTGMVFS